MAGWMTNKASLLYPMHINVTYQSMLPHPEVTVGFSLVHLYSYLCHCITSLKYVILVIIELGVINFINEIFIILIKCFLKLPIASSECLFGFLIQVRLVFLDLISLKNNCGALLHASPMLLALIASPTLVY